MASIPTFYLTSFQAFILALFLASVSGISSDILSGILSGISWRFFVIEVRRGTLWSGACGGGPAGLSAFSKPWNRAAAGKRPGRLAAHGMMNHLSAPPALLLSLPMVSPFFCASCQQLERADWLAPSATPQDACGCHFASLSGPLAFQHFGLLVFRFASWIQGLRVHTRAPTQRCSPLILSSLGTVSWHSHVRDLFWYHYELWSRGCCWGLAGNTAI